MKAYILELLPDTNGFELRADMKKGEQMDAKIIKFFNKWKPSSDCRFDQASTLMELNDSLNALYSENILWWNSERKTFLQYTTYSKGNHLELYS